MPLTGSGDVMAASILTAIGNPDPAAVPAFGAVGNALATWLVANVSVAPGTMAAAAAVVAGLGKLDPQKDEHDLGPLLAAAAGDPSPGGVTAWTGFAKGIIGHLKTFGSVVGSTFVNPTPSGGPLTGTALLTFANVLVTPPLGTDVGVDDAAAAAMIGLFGAAVLTHIASVTLVLPLALVAPFVPLTGPASGPIIGAGSLS